MRLNSWELVVPSARYIRGLPVPLRWLDHPGRCQLDIGLQSTPFHPMQMPVNVGIIVVRVY